VVVGVAWQRAEDQIAEPRRTANSVAPTSFDPKSQWTRQMTTTAAGLPAVGEKAPDFTLGSTADEDVTLSDFGGESNVVLAFFPLAFTSVCTAEMCSFTDDYTLFEGVNAKVFGVSVDSVPSLKEFKAKHGIGIDLLSDFKRDACRAYGTLIEDAFFSRRAYVIIDREGVVQWSFMETELGQRRDNAELLDQLRLLT
jgi:peroxiredoxin